MTNWGLEEPEREQIDSLSVLLRDILLDSWRQVAPPELT